MMNTPYINCTFLLGPNANAPSGLPGAFEKSANWNYSKFLIISSWRAEAVLEAR